MSRGRHQCSQAWQQRQEAAQQQRHAAWVTTYAAIHTLHAQGLPVTTSATQLGRRPPAGCDPPPAPIPPLHAQGLPVPTIATQLGISRPTVYAYLRRATPPSP